MGSLTRNTSFEHQNDIIHSNKPARKMFIKLICMREQSLMMNNGFESNYLGVSFPIKQISNSQNLVTFPYMKLSPILFTSQGIYYSNKFSMKELMIGFTSQNCGWLAITSPLTLAFLLLASWVLIFGFLNL